MPAIIGVLTRNIAGMARSYKLTRNGKLIISISLIPLKGVLKRVPFRGVSLTMFFLQWLRPPRPQPHAGRKLRNYKPYPPGLLINRRFFLPRPRLSSIHPG